MRLDRLRRLGAGALIAFTLKGIASTSLIAYAAWQGAGALLP